MSIVDYRSALMLAIYFVVAVDLHTVQGFSTKIRSKRWAQIVKVPAKWVMNKFLKDSKPMNAGLFDDGLWSTKPGGFRRAITEFKSFNPTNMKPTKEGYGVEGTIGDFRVFVERDGPRKQQATVTIKNKNTYKTNSVICDREFDRKAQKKGRLGKMSKSHEAKRGVQSVRCHYGVDESKIHPSLLDAMPDEELESIK